MDSEQDQGAPPPPAPSRRFTSSIQLSEPSRRSQVLMWLLIGLAGSAVLLVVLLYYTSGFGLWFSR
jgi:type IV secretory pathway TrbD component